MFLGNTQLKELLLELNLNLHKFDNVKDIIEDLKEKGGYSKYLSMTDQDNQQICIKINEDVYIYSQQTAIFYDWNVDNERDVGNYFTETYNLSELSDEEINNSVAGFYGSLGALKKEVPDNWKQIAAECIFEEEALGN
ncbi:hypothetical protein [Aliarcobacter butzleri]|uniref:hypothetical protein n=1 Tax=Aliarcobacter butzleri TaxID=28197 RepID=UPI00344B0061